MTTKHMAATLAALTAMTGGLAVMGQAQTPPAAKPAPARRHTPPRPPAYAHSSLKDALPYLYQAKAKLQHNYRGDESARQQAIAAVNQAISICDADSHPGQKGY